MVHSHFPSGSPESCSLTIVRWIPHPRVVLITTLPIIMSIKNWNKRTRVRKIWKNIVIDTPRMILDHSLLLHKSFILVLKQENSLIYSKFLYLWNFALNAMIVWVQVTNCFEITCEKLYGLFRTHFRFFWQIKITIINASQYVLQKSQQ